MLTSLRRISILLLLVSSITHISAQDESRANKRSKKPHISLIAIGDPPPITLSVGKDKLSTYNIPPKSERPPSALYFKDPKRDKGLKKFGLALNRPSSPIPRPSSQTLQLFENPGDAGNFEKTPYLQMNLPKEKSNLTVFLVRNRNSQSWERNPQVYPFSDNLESYPPSSLRVINLSNMPLYMKIGTSKFNLKPQQMRILNLPVKTQGIIDYAVAAKTNKGQMQTVAQNGLVYYKNSRLNLVMYATDSKKATKPISSTTFLTPN